jgi:hypothetical protein
MELYACVHGLPFTGHDPSVSRIIGAFLRSWNDSLDDETRQKLIPYVTRIKDTNDGHDETRAWMCVDWLTRECAPAFLELTESLRSHAEALHSLSEITDHKTLKAASGPTAAAWAVARDAAWAVARAVARDAARDAARAAARDAAGDAARAAAAAGDAAWAVARDAAGDAARAAAAAWAVARAAAAAAAGDAAWAVAGAVAGDAAAAAAWRTLTPIVARVQESAFRLLDRMCDIGRAA